MILNLIFIPVALVAAFAVCFGCELSPWLLFALIPGGYVAVVALYFLMLFIASLLMPRKAPKGSGRVCRWFISYTMEWLMLLMGIRVKLTGAERLPDCPCVLVSNHRSDFDPMTLLAVLKSRKLVYISKQENFKLPIVGPFLRNAGFVPIDRGNGVRAVKTLQTAAEYMKRNGVDIGVYPEGTRSKTGKLLRFKPGACYLAQQAEAPIVVMTTQGTERISKRFLFSPLCVELKVVEVIDRERVMSTNQNDLIEEIRATVERALPAEVTDGSEA